MIIRWILAIFWVLVLAGVYSYVLLKGNKITPISRE